MVVRWFANPMLDAYRDMVERYPSLWVLEPSFPKHLRDVISAISEGDEELAIDATRAYYVRVDGALRAHLQPAPPPRLAEPAELPSPQDSDGTVVPIRRRRSPA
jgi:DNA-binding GntR family transcriptional regulator